MQAISMTAVTGNKGVVLGFFTSVQTKINFRNRCARLLTHYTRRLFSVVNETLATVANVLIPIMVTEHILVGVFAHRIGFTLHAILLGLLTLVACHFDVARLAFTFVVTITENIFQGKKE